MGASGSKEIPFGREEKLVTGRGGASAFEILKPCLEQPGAAQSALICAEHHLAQTA